MRTERAEMITSLDETIESRIHEMTAQIFILEAVQRLLDTAKRIGESARLEDYPAVRSELVRLKSRCDSLMITVANYEASYGRECLTLLHQGGGYENEY